MPIKLNFVDQTADHSVEIQGVAGFAKRTETLVGLSQEGMGFLNGFSGQACGKKRTLRREAEG